MREREEKEDAKRQYAAAMDRVRTLEKELAATVDRVSELERDLAYERGKYAHKASTSWTEPSK
jgi:predicted RNase H-like nuclease (RuvC/YqgF family)